MEFEFRFSGYGPIAAQPKISKRNQQQFLIRMNEDERELLAKRDFQLICTSPEKIIRTQSRPVRPVMENGRTGYDPTDAQLHDRAVKTVNFNSSYRYISEDERGVYASYADSGTAFSSTEFVVSRVEGANFTAAKQDNVETTAALGYSQLKFVGGRVLMIPCDFAKEPVVAIEAEYQANNKPYCLAEIVSSQIMKPEYYLDDYRYDIHHWRPVGNDNETFTLGDMVASGTSTGVPYINFDNIQINEAWSVALIYCSIAEAEQDTELVVSGLNKLYFDLSDLRVIFNEKVAWDFSGQNYYEFLYRTFIKCFPDSNLSYMQWRRHPIIAFRPEDLCYQNLQEGRYQVGNLNVEIRPKLTPEWKQILDECGSARTHLTTNVAAQVLSLDGYADGVSKSYARGADTLAYFKALRLSLRMVLCYENMILRVGQDGSMERVLNRIPALGPSGFDRNEQLTGYAVENKLKSGRLQ